MQRQHLLTTAMVTVQHSTHAESATASGKSGHSAVELETERTENTFVAGDFSASAEQARDLLGKLSYTSNSRALQTRASYVLLQADYELDRYSQLCSFLPLSSVAEWQT